MSEFSDLLAALCPSGVEFKPLGEVGELIRGRRFTKADYVSDGLGSIHYGEVYTYFGTSAVTVQSHVRSELRDSLRLARPGDVVIAATGETAEEVGKAVAWLGESDVAVHDDCYIFRHDLDPLFVSYFFQTAAFHAQKSQHVTDSKLARIPSAGLATIEMPVPPTAVQSWIARTLGVMEQLGAELAAERDIRLRQYGWYAKALLRSSLPTRRVGDVFEVLPTSKGILRSDYGLGTTYPIVDQGRQLICGYTDDASLLVDRDDVIVFGDHTRAVKWVGRPFAVGADGVKVLACREGLLPRFALHALRTLDIPSRGYNRHWTVLREMSLPFPELGQQKMLADKLDTLTKLADSPEAGLSAEIAARRQQFAYYREKLFAFEGWPS